MVNKGHGQHSQRPAQGPDDSIVALATKHCCGTMRTVHRLDRDAAGLMVLAKTKEAATALSAAFADHTARRTYRAAIGVPLPIGTSGTVDAPLKWAGGRCWVDPSGVAAVTHYSVVER
ncbi:MAG: 23S rRNA pseudouridine1911/1915/1917 synthase, partial [Myxococcota bacterium]